MRKHTLQEVLRSHPACRAALVAGLALGAAPAALQATVRFRNDTQYLVELVRKDYNVSSAIIAYQEKGSWRSVTARTARGSAAGVIPEENSSKEIMTFLEEGGFDAMDPDLAILGPGAGKHRVKSIRLMPKGTITLGTVPETIPAGEAESISWSIVKVAVSSAVHRTDTRRTLRYEVGKSVKEGESIEAPGPEDGKGVLFKVRMEDDGQIRTLVLEDPAAGCCCSIL